MKPTWSKTYGPPWDYAKKAQRELDAWAKSGTVGCIAVDPGLTEPCLISFAELSKQAQVFYGAHNLQATIEELSKVKAAQYAKQHEDYVSECLTLASVILENAVTVRLVYDLGVTDTSFWMPALRRGEVLIISKGTKRTVAMPASNTWRGALAALKII